MESQGVSDKASSNDEDIIISDKILKSSTIMEKIKEMIEKTIYNS